VRRRLAVMVVAAALAVLGCAPGEQADPHAVLDRAIVAGWDRVTVQVGFSLDIAAPPDAELPVPATSIRLAPDQLRATVDFRTGQWRVQTAIPHDGLGVSPEMLGVVLPGVRSIDAEVLYDGTSLYAKSPLLPLYLEPIAGLQGGPIEGDLTGWVRFGSAEDLAMLGLLANPFGGLPGIPALGDLPLPSPGDAALLRTFLEDLGVGLEYAGADDDGGVKTHHLSASLNLAKLAESREFAALTGFGRDQLEPIFNAAGEVRVAAQIWTYQATGRLATVRLDIDTESAPAVIASLVIQLTEPAEGTSFDPPAVFTDLPLGELLQNPFSNDGGMEGQPGVLLPMP
jgi:hypothetical protein